MATDQAEGSTPKTSSTTVNIVDCVQVVNIVGDHNIVSIPNAKILVNRQNVASSPGPTSSAGNGQPNSSVVGRGNPHQMPPTPENGLAAADVSQSNARTRITYAAGPPGDIEVVELTQKLMSLREDWTILGAYLQLPDHEMAAADVDERTLYRKISRVLNRWINYDIANDRQKLALVLTQARSDLGRFAEEVLQKAN